MSYKPRRRSIETEETESVTAELHTNVSFQIFELVTLHLPSVFRDYQENQVILRKMIKIQLHPNLFYASLLSS